VIINSAVPASRASVALLDHVRLINSIQVAPNVTNYIFRGSLPEYGNNTFAYDELVNT